LACAAYFAATAACEQHNLDHCLNLRCFPLLQLLLQQEAAEFNKLPHRFAAGAQLQLLSMALQQRQLRSKGSQSLASSALALALAPALYVSSLAGAALQLPVRIAVFWLQLADALICDVLAFLTKQPGHKAQVCHLLIPPAQQQQSLQMRCGSCAAHFGVSTS
jgi:hypothetical protein